MTASKFLDSCRRLGTLKTVFAYPYVRVIIGSASFETTEDYAREAVLAKELKTTINDLRCTLQNGLLSLKLLTPAEFVAATGGFEERERGHHWLGALTASEDQRLHKKINAVRIPTLHFYGYKGGQARSTLLGVTACALARSGWNVLALDSDIEAPSLDVIFARAITSLSRTLLGVVQGVAEIEVTNVRAPRKDEGRVDLIACRPRAEEFDIDMAAFALRSSLEPMILEKAADRIASFAVGRKYDVLLIDHRSGLSPSTLPLLASVPGPCVICVKMDDQWRSAKNFLKEVLRAYPPNPGIFVTWKPDSENEDAFRNRTFGQKDELLSLLANSLRHDAQQQLTLPLDDEELSSVELEDHWVVWPYDEVFRSNRLPEADQLSVRAKDAIDELRGVLGLVRDPNQVLSNGQYPTTSPSGSTDEGDLILTKALRDLLIPNNPYSYIFGRKGTGKTRLLRELAQRKIGEPLLVASDSQDERGLKSSQPEIQSAADRLLNQPETFWWCLIAAAIKTDTTSRGELAAEFKSLSESGKPGEILDWIVAAVKTSRKRTFLFDGIETTFHSRQIFGYLEALFRVLQTVESDSRLSDRLGFRLFLRSDLAERGFQNIEQQTYGKVLWLSWEYQAILNFMLSRIIINPWYKLNFSELTEQLLPVREQILKGDLPQAECETLLLQAFPEKLKRNNLLTKTFLRTYFADSASERTGATDRLRYYPRIFARLIEAIPELAEGKDAKAVDLETGRISQNLIFQAHEDAANRYLTGLKEELRYLIDLAEDLSDNQERLDALLAAFDGLKTPFEIEERIEELVRKTQLDPSRVRRAMDRMKTVGMFESRPDYPGEWRVGRLFKSSLRMKYVRRSV